MAHLYRVSTQTSHLSGFFHIPFVDGWQEQIMPLDVHVIDKALSVQTMIIQKKCKQQTVVQLNKYHHPNTVYLKGIRRPIKILYITVLKITQQHSQLEEWHPQIKAGNIKFAPLSFSHVITLQCYVSVELDFYVQLFKTLFKTATNLQNMGNISKKLRS